MNNVFRPRIATQAARKSWRPGPARHKHAARSAGKVAMRIVFLGNCQEGALSKIIQRFVAPYVDINTGFVDAYNLVNTESHDRLHHADVVVAQASRGTPALGPQHAPAGITVHLVPVVSGSFLYPYRGVPHPANPIEAAGTSPCQAEFNDRYLAKLYLAKVDPEEALQRYLAHGVAGAANPLHAPLAALRLSFRR